MEYLFKINAECKTSGKGLWNKTSKRIVHKKMLIDIKDWSIEDAIDKVNGKINKDSLYGELLVFFSPKTWDTKKYGLIYTDPQWIKDLRESLINIGFSKVAVKDIGYSEQGMQGDNFVSLDIGNKFIDCYLKKFIKKSIMDLI